MTLKMNSVVAGIALSVIALASGAGEFNESNGVAIKGYDPVAFFKENKPVRGKDDFRFEYKGSTFIFANDDSRAAFAADPEKYAPQYGGTARSAPHVATRPTSIPRHSLSSTAGYLNYNTQVQRDWRQTARTSSGRPMSVDRR